MIDLKLFETIFLKQEEGFITDDDKITVEVMEFLTNPRWGLLKIQSLFRKSEKGERNQFECEIPCLECGKIFWTVFSKIGLFDFIAKKRKQRDFGYYCEDCYSTIQAREEDERKQKAQQEKQEKIENQKAFIDNYLNPEKEWNETLSISQRFYALKEKIRFSNEKEITAYIQEMPYYDFLKTPYWKAIALKVKKAVGFKCQLCGTTGDSLNVHHNTYVHHGYELDYWQTDLICLCRECHSKHHVKPN